VIQIPALLIGRYLTHLGARGVSSNDFPEFKKWLRYYLDFCSKYRVTGDDSERLRMFIDKLKRKNQTVVQQQQAAYAVKLYFEIQAQISIGTERQGSVAAEMSEEANITSTAEEYVTLQSSAPQNGIVRVEPRSASQYSVAGYQEKSDSPEWDAAVKVMADEIKVRHYPARH